MLIQSGNREHILTIFVYGFGMARD